MRCSMSYPSLEWSLLSSIWHWATSRAQIEAQEQEVTGQEFSHPVTLSAQRLAGVRISENPTDFVALSSQPRTLGFDASLDLIVTKSQL